MGKNVIFCADGTWNSPGQTDADSDTATVSNVFKLFLNLAGADSPDTTLLANEQERTFPQQGAVAQVAKYLHGVGDSNNFLVKMLGGSMGAGLVTRIVRGYTFVSRNYQPGDKIFLIGFSRGAYTVRSLAGLIAAKGLLDGNLGLDDKEQAYKLGAAVWYSYRQSALAAADRHDFLGDLETAVDELPGFFLRPVPVGALTPPPPIDTVAVWDTVGALGIPEYNRDQVAIDAFRFCDTKLSPKVSHGVHAVSLDEQRPNFAPTLWDPDDRITQTLFPGAHADVGGGYPRPNNESGLSDGALRWMMDQLAPLGVVFATNPAVPCAPDPKGMAHRPWADPLWQNLPPGPHPRTFTAASRLQKNPSIAARMAAGNVPSEGELMGPYAPTNLPP